MSWKRFYVDRHEYYIGITRISDCMEMPGHTEHPKFAIGQEVVFCGGGMASVTPWTIANVLIPVMAEDEYIYVLTNGPSRIYQSEHLLELPSVHVEKDNQCTD